MKKFVTSRPYADPEAACRKIMELAFAFTSPLTFGFLMPQKYYEVLLKIAPR